MDHDFRSYTVSISESDLGFIVLIAVGGVLSWLASILTRSDDGRSITIFLTVGVAGALLAGWLVSDESLIVGLSATTLLAGLAGSVLSLAALALARRRITR